MKIIIVGAGIFGASAAYHLSQQPAFDVTLLEAGPSAACGVTGLAFGWINLIYSTPDDRARYELQRQAFAYHQSLLKDFPALYGEFRRGSLIWRESAQQTEALVRQQQQAGTAVELIDNEKIRQLEPHLVHVPEVAAYVADDIALNPGRLAASLLAAARSRGASIFFDQPVCGVDTQCGRVSGVRTETRSLPADVIIIAGGQGTAPLVQAFMPELALSTSPTILFRFSAERQAIGHIVCGPDIEVRQEQDGTVLAAEGYIDDDPHNAPQAFGLRLKTLIEAHFPLLGRLGLSSARVGHRPMLAGGMPHMGPVPGTEGLYLAVGHPGIILAPLAGKMLADTLARDG